MTKENEIFEEAYRVIKHHIEDETYQKMDDSDGDFTSIALDIAIRMLAINATDTLRRHQLVRELFESVHKEQ